MSKRVVIVRHAKSSWADPSLRDLDRPLNKRGYRDAPKMALYLSEREAIPRVLISSPALRAQLTAKAMLKSAGVGSRIELNEQLYHASALTLERVISATDNSIDGIMLVGHNPGMTELVNRLTHLNLMNLPTAGVVDATFDAQNWDEVVSDNCVLAEYYYPKGLD